MQLHKILIGLVLTSILAVGFMSFLSTTATQYSTDYSDVNLTSFDNMNELSQDIEAFEGNESTVETDSGITDLLGSFFTNMYQSARVLKGSGDVMTGMVDESVDSIPMESGLSTALKTGLTLMIVIVIGVGIFLAFVTKSERT